MMLLMVVLPVLFIYEPTKAGSQSYQAEAANFAIGISALESQGAFDQIYDSMHPDAKAIIPRSAVVGWYEADFAPQNPHPISEILAVRTVSWAWPVTGVTYPTTFEIDFVQPFGVGTRLSYVNETVRIVPTDSGYGWFFGRSKDFVDQQIARFPGEIEGNTSAITHRQNESPNSSQYDSSACALVELFPGYPGYRGNITGVMAHWNGLGDYECLEVLELGFPEFNRAVQDQANQRAAEALGISGPMNLWTWENWMQIEAQRRMIPQCYTCLMYDVSAIPLRTDIQAPSGDYRILSGLPGNKLALTTITSSLGFGQYSANDAYRYYSNDDYILRAEAYLLGGPFMNAQELYSQMEQRVTETFTPGGTFPDTTAVLDFAIWQAGGYTWIPDSATDLDQAMTMWYAVNVAVLALVPFNEDIVRSNFQQSVDEWMVSQQSLPLDSFMQRQPYWQQFRQ